MSATSLHSQTIPLSEEQVSKLRIVLTEDGFEFETRPYMILFAKKGKVSVSVYEKGPKAVIQGKGLEDFILFRLEPEVLGEARMGYDEVHHPERFAPHFGIDESGKGDFFGPLVVAGVFVDGIIAKHFQDIGIRDSKNISSDKKIRDLANLIRKSNTPTSVVMIGPDKYNVLLKKFRNLNHFLAWGHARVIENLLDLVPGCPRALSDQFANPTVLQRALLEKGQKIQLDQQTKAESDYAVAAASILAREKLIDWFDQMTQKFGITIPRGASARTKEVAKELAVKHGVDVLQTTTKTHFKTYNEVLATL
ncbi:MAG: ribonuclease HIII [Chthoniobacterales bacterium]